MISPVVFAFAALLAASPASLNSCHDPPQSLDELPEACFINNLTIVSTAVPGKRLSCDFPTPIHELQTPPQVYLNISDKIQGDAGLPSDMILVAYDAAEKKVLWAVSNPKPGDENIVSHIEPNTKILKPYEAVNVSPDPQQQKPSMIFALFERMSNGTLPPPLYNEVNVDQSNTWSATLNSSKQRTARQIQPLNEVAVNQSNAWEASLTGPKDRAARQIPSYNDVAVNQSNAWTASLNGPKPRAARQIQPLNEVAVNQSNAWEASLGSPKDRAARQIPSYNDVAVNQSNAWVASLDSPKDKAARQILPYNEIGVNQSNAWEASLGGPKDRAARQIPSYNDVAVNQSNAWVASLDSSKDKAARQILPYNEIGVNQSNAWEASLGNLKHWVARSSLSSARLCGPLAAARIPLYSDKGEEPSHSTSTAETQVSESADAKPAARRARSVHSKIHYLKPSQSPNGVAKVNLTKVNHTRMARAAKQVDEAATAQPEVAVGEEATVGGEATTVTTAKEESSTKKQELTTGKAETTTAKDAISQITTAKGEATTAQSPTASNPAHNFGVNFQSNLAIVVVLVVFSTLGINFASK